jgi:hypothetical protein
VRVSSAAAITLEQAVQTGTGCSWFRLGIDGI